MKILYVSTISNTINAFLIPHIKMLVDQGHQVDVAFRIEREVNPEIVKMGCKVYEIEFQRSPFSKRNLSAYKSIIKIILNGDYDLIHTHTPVASALVRIACRHVNKTKVFYTAHGFHFYKGAPLMNWLLYYTTERWLARYTDVLITMNIEDYQRAKKSLLARKVEYVPGVGINVSNFVRNLNIGNSCRTELGISNNTTVILSIGELTKRKNHETALKAIAQLANEDIVYLIAGTGPLNEYLLHLAESLGISDKVKFLGYRKDIPALCSAADIYVFPSFQEGLPVSLMEAMAAGLPCVASRIRGITDLIEESKGGYLYPPNDINGFAEGIRTLIKDQNLRLLYSAYNCEHIKKYDISNILNKMQELYSNEL